jgi:hypothetical protein
MNEAAGNIVVDTYPHEGCNVQGPNHQGLWWSMALCLGILIIFHFAMVLCAVMPTSPLKAALGPLSVRYVYPYFGQNWNFFAPTPVDKTELLVARARWFDTTRNAVVETPWADVNQPLIEQERRSRLSPLGLVQLGVSNSVMNYVNTISKDPRASTLDKDGKTRIFRMPIPASIDPIDLSGITRAALSSFAVQYPGRRLQQVQIGVLIKTFPRFANRAQPDSASQQGLIYTDWRAAQEVPAFCCR